MSRRVPPVVIAKYSGRCRSCGRAFGRGTRIIIGESGATQHFHSRSCKATRGSSSSETEPPR